MVVDFRDLVTLILSSIPKLNNAESLHESFITELKNRDDIPENAYTCVISNYAYFKNVPKVILWVDTMEERGISIKYKFVAF